MLDYIIELLPLVVVIAICAVSFFLYRSGLEKYARQLLICLVTSAEQTYGEKTGKLKYSAVASKLYEIMPKVFKFIFSERAIAKMIELAVSEMKELLGSEASVKDAVSEEEC